MLNRYPARCTYCTGVVSRNSGKLWRQGRRWMVAHMRCDDDLLRNRIEGKPAISHNCQRPK